MKKSLTELHTETFTAEREWTVDGIPVLSACVCVPQPVPAMDRVSRRIWRYYQLQCRSFLRYCEGWLLPQAADEYRAALEASTPLPQFQATLNYRVTYNEGGLWSLYTQSREVTLPGQTLMQRWGGYLGPADRLSGVHGGVLPPALRLEAAADGPGSSRDHPAGGGGHRPVPENWKRLLRRRFNARSFYLTDEGLTFFYPMYAIAPAVEGIPLLRYLSVSCGSPAHRKRTAANAAVLFTFLFAFICAVRGPPGKPLPPGR